MTKRMVNLVVKTKVVKSYETDLIPIPGDKIVISDSSVFIVEDRILGTGSESQIALRGYMGNVSIE